MDEKEVYRLLECRKAIDTHKKREFKTEEEHTESVNMMNKIVNGYGFKSLQDYSRWDEERCVEAYMELAPDEDECKGCKSYNKAACDNLLKSVKRYTFYHALRERMLGDDRVIIAFSSDWKGDTGLCPIGHEFHKTKSIEDVTKKAPFDLSWEVFV